jgi:metal-responsive CopG/Arc/MetJ family transcriptional regulator
MEKNKKIIALSLDRALLDRLNAAHNESGEKSRSRYVETLIDRALTEEGDLNDGQKEKPADVSGT